MEQGHADEVAVGRGEGGGLRQPEAGQVAVAMRDEDALRRTGRARGVHDHRHVTRRGSHKFQVGRRPERAQLGEHQTPGRSQARRRRRDRIADDDQGLGCHRAGHDVAEVRGQAVLQDDDAGLGVVKLVLEERAAQAGIDRHPDGAELHRGEEHPDRLGPVADQAQHAIAGPDPERGQRSGQRVRPCVELAEGEGLAVLEADERPVALLGGLAAEQVDQRPLAPRRPAQIACRISHQADGIRLPAPGAGRRSLRRAT